MLSDARIQAALTALSAATGSFRAALATAVEQVQRHVAAHSPHDGHALRLGAELGAFAAERINVDRFAQVFAETRSVEPVLIEAVERALQTLEELSALGAELFVANVPPAGCLRDTVARALEQIGRVFAATRVVELAKSQPGPDPERLRSLDALPFRSWNKAQRLLAPPLVVHVDGADLYVGGLAEFLDGGQKFVLVVRGECPPAALVRLITPDVLVAQSTDSECLRRLAACNGPAVAALVPEGTAQFIHDPRGGQQLWQRLAVSSLPQTRPLKALGGFSAAQQAAELDQLRALAAAPAADQPAATAAAAAPAGPEAVERLANWLINQAGIE
ncbi:MAG: hypothetical protein HY699_24065 [Deltaproteobacteria bacterium]|nr:hypothetical protein [Deltaproteobacteria bacterium]